MLKISGYLLMNIDRLHKIRRDYNANPLTLENTPDQPLALFSNWFEQTLKANLEDPNAMVLATADAQGIPDARIVLLKGVMDGKFIFYTNYGSAKGKQLSDNPHAALNFFWPSFCRQIRIKGKVSKTSTSISDDYFASRPVDSQIGAIASKQSEVVTRKQLEKDVENYAQSTQQPYNRPENWGGYCVTPESFEFWHGRSSRLHDRIYYVKSGQGWTKQRLAP
jgi:pyridoxamine 5'-phosphate oxidase